MDTLERRCTCSRGSCYLCQLDRFDSERRGVPLALTHPASFSLEELTDDASLREQLEGKTVLIWSGEHRAYWGPDGSGYTMRYHEAGRYNFADAWRRSSHADTEKGIEYEVIETQKVPEVQRAGPLGF